MVDSTHSTYTNACKYTYIYTRSHIKAHIHTLLENMYVLPQYIYYVTHLIKNKGIIIYLVLAGDHHVLIPTYTCSYLNNF